MIPALFIFDFKWDLTRFATPAYLFNIFYLGLGASAICFVTWNMAVRILGAIKTSVYIYLAPVVTAVTSVIILHEKISFLSGLGILLVLGIISLLHAAFANVTYTVRFILIKQTLKQSKQ